MQPLNAPTSSDTPSASGIASQIDMPAFIVMPITMPDSTSTAPTDRSMPPVTMTAVMPIAMIATKAKLRVTLNRFCCVAKTSLANDSTTKATTAAIETQKVCWLASQREPVAVRAALIDGSSRLDRHDDPLGRIAWWLHHAVSMAPVIRPVTSSGELCAIGLSATLLAAAQHDDAVGHREHVGHAVADQHHRDAVVAQPADQVQHLGHLAHADRRGRLVHQHDLAVRQARARDRHRLALAARHAAHEVARPRLGLQLGEQLAGALEHGAVVEHAQRAEAAHQLAAEEHVLRRGEVVAQREILVDDLDAFVGARRRACGRRPCGPASSACRRSAGSCRRRS